MALVTVSIRTRMTVAVLRVRDDVIVMQTLLWPDEVRSPEFASLGGGEAARPAELAMASMLVESLAGDYDPADFEDDYQQAVEALVQAKLEGGQVTEVEPAAADTSGEVVDLLAALQRSVDRAKQARGEPVEQRAADAPEQPAPEETAPAKAPARKAPTKKAPAKQNTRKSAEPGTQAAS